MPNDEVLIGQKQKEEELQDGTIFDDDIQAFRTGSGIEVVARKDDKGDYPTLVFVTKDAEGKEHQFSVSRDEMAAITFALSRQDQQHKLLTARFREYKEVPVRIVVQTTKDIKKGDFVVIWRKEKVPLDFNYSKI